MLKAFRSVATVVAASSCFLVVGCGSTAAPAEAPVKQELVMGFVPSQTSSIVQTNADVLGQYLSQKTGYHVTPRVLTSYAAVTEGMTSNNVDIGWVGPLDYVIAHKINKAEAVTKSVRNGLPSYKAFIIVNKSAGINSIKDLKGKKFAFGDPLSTSSNLYPRYAMKKAGLDPDKDVQATSIANQSQIAVNVCQNAVNAGAIYDDARKNKGVDTSCPGVMDKTAIIATSDPIPGDPQMIRHNLNSGQKKKLRDAMIAMGSDPSIAPALKAVYTIDSLVAAQDSDYDVIRDIVREAKPELLNTGASASPSK